MKTWREAAAPIIAQVIAAHADAAAARRALRSAYPFGERRCHPYAVWCHEARVQLARRYGTPLPPAMRSRSKRSAAAVAEMQARRQQPDLFALS